MVTSDRKPATPRQIAVVDDDAAVLKALERMLTAAGYRVRPFRSADEFLAHAGGHDGIILDVQLPGLSGIELEHRLREIAPGVPIVFFTACCETTRVRIAQQTGRVCVRKPDHRGALLAAVEEAFRRT